MTTEGFKRKLTTILSADVAGYSRLMGEDEAATVETITVYRQILADLIKQHGGRVVDSPGDNLLAEFASVVDAVQCAVAVQKELQARNAGLPQNRRMQFRIGINLGDVIQEEDRIYGDGVNIAARLEGLANPGGICISKTAFDQIESKLPYGYEFLGDQPVKNIAKPVGAYHVLMEPRVTVAKKSKKEKSAPVRRIPILVGAIAVLVLAVAVGIWQFYMRHPSVEPASVEKMAYPLPDKPSIAVLPFDNLSDDPEQEWFSDGMTEDLITDLSKIKGIFVISRNSTFSYKGKSVKLKTISEELGVRYILEGSVRRSGDQVRINAQLVDAKKDHHIWAERFDDTFQNIFELQDKITKKIVSALSVQLSIAEKSNVSIKETTNMIAYDAFLKGKNHFNKVTPDDFIRAIGYFEQAIKIDPNYSRAYAALGLTYHMATNVTFSAFFKKLNIDWRMARLKAVHYLKLAMKNPTFEAYSLSAAIEIHRRHYKEAIAFAEKALSIAPNATDGNSRLAWILIFAGRPEEGIEYLNKALQLDPNPRTLENATIFIGVAHFSMGQLEKAIEFIKKGQIYNPELHIFSGFSAASYALLGQNIEAKKALENYLIHYPDGFHPSIQTLYYGWPFKNVEVFDRLAEGLVKAGLPGDPSDYYKVVEENKLTGKEIRETFYGHTLTGITPWSEWWLEYGKEGNFNYKVTRTDSEGKKREFLEKGISWIEGDMECRQFEKIFDGLTNCSEIYRNPDGNADTKSEYLDLNYFRLGLYSVVD